jgi:hypothetical protein
MNLNITTLVGAGAIAATFLFGGSAILDSTPAANAKPIGSSTPKDPYQTCRSGGGSMEKCCDQVGGMYVSQVYTNSKGQTVFKNTCTYVVAGRQTADSSTDPGTPGTVGHDVSSGADSISS